VIGIADFLGLVQSEGPNREGVPQLQHANRNQNAREEGSLLHLSLWPGTGSKASAVMQVAALEEGEVNSARGIELPVFDERRARVFGAAHVSTGINPKHRGRVLKTSREGRPDTARPQARPLVSLCLRCRAQRDCAHFGRVKR
jgi:hypothetical protein